MLRRFLAGGLQDVQEGDHVGIHVGVGIGDGVAYARLGRKVDDARRRGSCEQRLLRGTPVGHVDLLKAEPWLGL